jgi:hypothetical protein
MPVRLTHLAEQRRALEIPQGDDVIKVVYDPQGITPEAESRLMSAESSNRGWGPAIAETLAGILIEWDVEDGEGNPYPPTLNNLMHLKTAFLSVILNAVFTDVNPNPQPSTASRSGSATPKGRHTSTTRAS